MIELSHISKTFSSGRGEVNAVVDVTLGMPKGSLVAIMGKSGSGKSTLLNCIGGLEKPDKGEILCFGTPVHQLRTRQLSHFLRGNVGFVFQRGNLLSYLNVADNIGFPLVLNGMGRAECAQRIATLLNDIGLENAAKAMPHELSGGEIQRVSVARAVAHHPRLLLVDEPTASLDTASGSRVVKLMRNLGKERGCTMIMATHDVDITHNSDILVELKDGQIIRNEEQ